MNRMIVRKAFLVTALALAIMGQHGAFAQGHADHSFATLPNPTVAASSDSDNRLLPGHSFEVHPGSRQMGYRLP